MVAWHEVPGMRKKKEPVPEGRCDYVFARWSAKIVLACAKFRDGVDGGSYSIILSLRVCLPLLQRRGQRRNRPKGEQRTAQAF